MSEQNGTSPAQDTDTPASEAPCVDCASNGEKILGVLGLIFAALVVAMAFDILTNGKVSGFVAQARGGTDG